MTPSGVPRFANRVAWARFYLYRVCLLALLNLRPRKAWDAAENPLICITPIMDWVREHYGKDYAPNTRETFRRYSMHQLLDAGVVRYNPDQPDRPVNSPKAVYQIEPAALALLLTFNNRVRRDLPAWAFNRWCKLMSQGACDVGTRPGDEGAVRPT